jgi:hypothetical protein
MLIALAVVALTAPQEERLVDGVLHQPQWVQGPTAEMAAPAALAGLPSAGEAQLLCTLLDTGFLTGCVVESITPHDRRLENHALQLASHLRHEPRLSDGRWVTGLKVRFTIRWSPDR